MFDIILHIVGSFLFDKLAPPQFVLNSKRKWCMVIGSIIWYLLLFVALVLVLFVLMIIVPEGLHDLLLFDIYAS